MLLLAFPELKKHPGRISELLDAMNAEPGALKFWQQLVAQDIRPHSDDEGY